MADSKVSEHYISKINIPESLQNAQGIEGGLEYTPCKLVCGRGPQCSYYKATDLN